jgi:hypothetical protein
MPRQTDHAMREFHQTNRNTRTGRESGRWRPGDLDPRDSPRPHPSAFLAKSKPSLLESTTPSSVAKAAADPGSQRHRGAASVAARAALVERLGLVRATYGGKNGAQACRRVLASSPPRPPGETRALLPNPSILLLPRVVHILPGCNGMGWSLRGGGDGNRGRGWAYSTSWNVSPSKQL